MPDKIFAAVDCGAGTVNLRLGGRRKQKLFLNPSLVCEVSKESVVRGDAGVIDNSAFCFDGKYYYVGQAVSDRGLTSEDVTANARLKVTNAKKLVLATLVQALNLSHNAILDCGIVVSHHDPNSMGALLRSELEGIHRFSKGNNEFEITLKLPTHGVFIEGSALSVLMDSVNGKFGVLDLGYLTSLYSLRDTEGEVIGDATPQPNGVGALIALLQKETDFKKLLGGLEPTRDVLMQSLIEASGDGPTKLIYRASGQAVDFSGIYKTVVPKWLKHAAGKAVAALGERKGTGFQVIAIGGGCNLPLIAATLRKQGIQVYKGEGKDPIYANVESLYLRHVLSARRDKTFVNFIGERALEDEVAS